MHINLQTRRIQMSVMPISVIIFRKNSLRLSKLYTPKIALRPYLGCGSFLHLWFLDNVPNLLHRTAELPTCHRRRKTVIAD